MDTPIPNTQLTAAGHAGKGLALAQPSPNMSNPNVTGLARDRLLIELLALAHSEGTSTAAQNLCKQLVHALESKDGYFYGGIPEQDFLAMLDAEKQKNPPIDDRECGAICDAYATALQLQKKLVALREISAHGQGAEALRAEGAAALCAALKACGRRFTADYPEQPCMEDWFMETLAHMFEPPKNSASLHDTAPKPGADISRTEFEALAELCEAELLAAYRVGLYALPQECAPTSAQLQSMAGKLAHCKAEALDCFAQALRPQAQHSNVHGGGAYGVGGFGRY